MSEAPKIDASALRQDEAMLLDTFTRESSKTDRHSNLVLEDEALVKPASAHNHDNAGASANVVDDFWLCRTTVHLCLESLGLKTWGTKTKCQVKFNKQQTQVSANPNGNAANEIDDSCEGRQTLGLQSLGKEDT